MTIGSMQILSEKQIFYDLILFTKSSSMMFNQIFPDCLFKNDQSP